MCHYCARFTREESEAWRSEVPRVTAWEGADRTLIPTVWLQSPYSQEDWAQKAPENPGEGAPCY